MFKWTVALLLGAMAFCLPQQSVWGHGWLAQPRARQAVPRKSKDPDVKVFYNLMSGNGLGGKGSARLPKPLNYPDRVYPPNVCGDPYELVDMPESLWTHNRPFEAQATYTQGSRIMVTLNLDTNHGGRHAFRLCQGTVPTEACFAGNHLLGATGQQPPGGPSAGKRYWYIDYNGSGIGEMQVYTGYIQLPPEVSCLGGCILQWQWIGHHNCLQPCDASVPYDQEDWAHCGANANGAWKPTRSMCKPGSYFEMFLNCADIIITPKPVPAVRVQTGYSQGTEG
jgi:hypothetical protein